eukprot:TRINITY_DN17094_c0_g1_i2.p1 TRINITY_DN17094_c0_g1~~TRINITY_DN17094_c0_g1_i2.p1  ORF type:complete len:458 (-),score=60.81 TRINITY_DN17094_c0_g1_i2:73-1446(-)
MTCLCTPLCANARFCVFAFAVFVGGGAESTQCIDIGDVGETRSRSLLQAKVAASSLPPPNENEQREVVSKGAGDILGKHATILDRAWMHPKIGHCIAFGLALALPFVSLFLCWKSFSEDTPCRGEVATANAAAESTGGNDIAGSKQHHIVRLGTIAVFVYLVLLIATDTLVSYISQSSGGALPWDPAAIVLVVEATKCAVSIALSWMMEGQDATPSFPDLLGATIRLAPVAMLYAGNNCLVLYVLSKMQLSSFVIWRNTSVIFNAVLWIAYFRRPFSLLQTAGVVCLFFGLVVGDIEADGTVTALDRRVVLVVFSALCSAAASVVNESVLKGPFGTRTIGVNRMNTLLYAETSTILAIALVWCSRGDLAGVVSGFDRRFVVLVIAQASLGLCVSRVLVYTDSVTKVMASGVREILTIFVAPLFVASRLDSISVLSGTYILIAVLSYFVPVAKSNMKK